MPRIHDRDAIRAILNADPRWSLYALGDLAPGYFEHSEWYVPSDGAPAVLLLYRAVTPPVLFAAGAPQAVALLAAEAAEPAVYLHVKPETALALEPQYRFVDRRPMLRMALAPSCFRPEAADKAVRLGTADAARVERLYADGREIGESPDFFFPSMLERGVFFGLEEEGDLVAVAGTHLAVPEEGVGAVGNVYTRRDRRGRGLAGGLISAVTQELLRMNIPVVGLNVIQRNSAAIRVYERLGFVNHCGFVEGPAVLK